MQLASLIANFAGILIFLFIFWKRLKEDYASEIVFKSACLVLSGILAGRLLTFRFLGAWFFWAEFLGLLAGLSLAIYTLKIRFYESLEAVIISALPWLGLIFLEDSVVNASLISFLAFLVILIMVFVAYYLDTHYREFTWYKSGKIGFAGLLTLALIFVLRSAIAILGIPMLSLVGKFEAVISASFAFICFLLLYNLGRVIE